MLDKVSIIQKWYKELNEKWAKRYTFQKEVAACRIIQSHVKELLERVHLRKMSEMQESFKFFEKMHTKNILDAQIKIRYLWKKV